MNYIIFEDQNSSLLNPFSLTHPVFEIRCGIYTNIERIIENLSSDDSITLIVREELKELVENKYPGYSVNPDKISKGIFINSACLWNDELLKKIKNGRTYLNNDIVVAASSEDNIYYNDLNNFFELSKQIYTNIEIDYIKYLWDSIYLNSNQIKIDFLNLSNQKLGQIHSSTIIENDELVSVGENVLIKAGSIIDATNGPIIVSKNTKIDIGSLIQGPIFIGPNCTVNPGSKLRGNIILGPACKVGGEIEDSIIHGYSNKQHDGFLGHSYICEWVNLGANTNNSNLKNNYSNIRFSLNNEIIETKKQFLGLTMGDFSKSGISTMFNTGTYVGIGANVFGGGFQKKNIKSFQWGESEKTDIDKFINTCKIMKSRRNESLHSFEEILLRKIYKDNK